MYKFSEPVNRQLEMFEKSLPFGGKLDADNRWLKLASLIDWQKFEAIYAETFAAIGRPGIRAREVIGALILKYILAVSDSELTLQLTENPYFQYFIGMARFKNRPPFDSSTLTHVRKRLGEKLFDEFEQILINDLIVKKLIKPRALQVDATVYESEITYPTDCGLLNKARQYCVAQIKQLSQVIGCKVRTYCRVAQQAYVNFSKARTHTVQKVRAMQKALLQYLRRNIGQLSELILLAQEKGHAVCQKIVTTLETVKTLYEQQKTMYDQRINSITSRIVSFHKPYIRPIVRNKSGKKVEFGAKVQLSLVDGYLFADYINFENFHEGTQLANSIQKFQQRFDRQPDSVAMDNIYGSRKNRKYLAERNIRAAVKPLCRPTLDETAAAERRWRHQKQRERNQIEGAIGNSKTKYALGVVRAKLPETELSWIRMSLLSRNLVTAAKRI